MKENEKSFCVLPWIHSFVNFNGHYQVCCSSEEFHDSIDDENGQPYNVRNRPDISRVMNADLMKKLRSDMLQGRWHSVCTRCKEIEDHGGTSRRNIENREYASLISELISQTEADGSLKSIPQIRNIDYRLGNLCNLKCTMCSPQSTVMWIKEWNSVKPAFEQYSEEKIKEFSGYDWIEKDFLMEEFEEKIPFADRLHFAGGEPLITPQMVRMLRVCVEKDVAKNITLSYNTNITRLPPEVLELWKSFKEVKLLCSVDAYGSLNEYIRFPSRWEIIDRNLTFLDEHASDYNITEIILATTVQIYNVLELDELYHYLGKFKNIIPALNLINLLTPKYMQTTVLPVEVKKQATERLMRISLELKGKLPSKYEYLRENIAQTINFMNAQDLSSHLPVFRQVNAQIDKMKNVSLHKASPDLNKLLVQHYLNGIETQK